MTPRRPLRAAIPVAAGGVLTLTACGGGQNVLRPESPQQDRIGELFWIMLAGSPIGLGVVACFLLLGWLRRNRAGLPGGGGFPLVVFLLLYLWPWLERRVTGDHAFHNLLDRPRDTPWWTAIGAALLTWVVTAFFAGSMDRVDVTFGIPYPTQIWIYRVAVWVLPALALMATLRVCAELRRGEDVDRARKEAEREARIGARAPPRS